jgi:hypothetical protein
MNQIYISDSEMNALAITAAAGNITIKDIVGAACWNFAKHEDGIKHHCLREVWCEPPTSGIPPRPRRTLKEKLHALARRFFSAFSAEGVAQEGQE